MTLEQGTLIQNRYRIIEILGQGGMGAIYRAVDDNLGMEVVVKENLFTTEEYARQFRLEAVILANLRHPNLPRVSNHFVIKGQGQYLVMDYIEGEDLREWMDRDDTIPEPDVVAIGIALCDAIGYLHSQDPVILHRDIKPGNVRINSKGDIYLVDFGLAKIIQGDRATTTGARAMTPGYSPPEQYGSARTDHRSDIYALGATLYAALTGITPEDGLAQTMGQTELTPLRERNPRVSRQVASAIEKALAIYPEDRFQSAAEFKNELLKAQSKGVMKQSSPFSSKEELEVAAPDGAQYREEEIIGGIPASSSAPFSFGSTTEDEPKKRKKGRGCWGTFLRLFGLLVLLGFAIVYLLDPSLPTRLLGLGASPEATPSPTVTVVKTGEDTPAPFPSATETPLPTATHTPTLTPTPTTTPSPTPTTPPSPTLTPTKTPTPTITPTGGGKGQIAFASFRSGLPQVWIVDTDGKNLAMVTDVAEGACQPSWSPDGEKLVFISPCEENAQHYTGTHLYIINADGTGLEPLPRLEGEEGGEYDPAWSPDGEKIAFTGLQENRRQIYLLTLATGEITQISDGDEWDFQPAWSSDGERIVFISTRKGPSQVWVMFADGAFPERFTASKDLVNTRPALSPDGEEILFTQRVNGLPAVMRIPFADEGLPNEVKIYPDFAPMQEGRYSSDGRWYVFESWPTADTNHDIYLLPVEGGELQRITTDPEYDFDPAWRP